MPYQKIVPMKKVLIYGYGSISRLYKIYITYMTHIVNVLILRRRLN